MCPPGHHHNSFVATFALEDTIIMIAHIRHIIYMIYDNI